jgi:hypothetical protein
MIVFAFTVYSKKGQHYSAALKFMEITDTCSRPVERQCRERLCW